MYDVNVVYDGVRKIVVYCIISFAHKSVVIKIVFHQGAWLWGESPKKPEKIVN